jgi:TolB protein
MKRLAFLVWISAASLVSHAADFQQRIAFEQEDFVCSARRDGSDVKKLAAGSFPSISRDGTRVVFNTTEKSGTAYLRRIATVDVSNAVPSTFKEIPSNNCYYPTWSPDGKRILFTLRVDNLWDLGVVNSDGSNFRTIKKGAENQTTLYSPAWARDGQSIFCQDMTNVYQLDLDGEVLKQWKIETIASNANMSGDGRIAVSPDGRRLLLSVDMDEEHGRKDWDGPLPALWVFDLQTEKATRITPPKLFGWDGCWLDNDNVLFLSQNAAETEPSIYRMSLGKDSKDRKLVVKNARMPSASQ